MVAPKRGLWIVHVEHVEDDDLGYYLLFPTVKMAEEAVAYINAQRESWYEAYVAQEQFVVTSFNKFKREHDAFLAEEEDEALSDEGEG